MDKTVKKKITIFICIDWFLPAYKAGGPVQSIANMITLFQDNDIRYKIFCSDTDLDGSILQGIISDKWIKYNQYTDIWYVSKSKRTIKTLKTEIKKSGASVLFINGIYSWFFNIVPLLFCRAPRKIISVRGMLHPGALSHKGFKKKVFLFFGKLTGLYNRCEFHASSEEEKSFIIKALALKKKIFVAANFPRLFTSSSPLKDKGELKLISVALISPMKNHLLILKALQNCSYKIEYNIYGLVKDPGYWHKCMEEIKQMPQNISVQFHGNILPDKVEHVLQQNHVFILPSKSENFGHAIYEAFMAGKPVITSFFTPWNQLEYNKAGINADILSTEPLTDAIQFFAAMNQIDFEIWSKSAVVFAKKSLDIRSIKDQYRKMFFN